MPFAVDIPRVPEATIVIDGKIDEQSWEQAATIDGFTVYLPAPGVDPIGDTTVRILSDDQTLYVSFQATDPEPDQVRGGLGRRDSRREDDYVGLLLDPNGDGERAALFIVNPQGIQLDGNLVRGTDRTIVPWRGSWSSWDARWSSQGQRNTDGYAVEMAIPWTNIRHPKDVEKVGAIFFRRNARIGEMSSWPMLDTDQPGVLVQTAKLGGPGELPSGSGFTVIPEMTYNTTDQGPPDDRLNAVGLGPGITLQYDPGSSSQLLATVNPDFSQVESDQSKISINQRYSLQYEEKRPFFLEGQEWFSHPVEDLIYTRTMVTPLYGVRATTENDGWAVAALHVWDRRPSASISEGGGWTSEQIEDASALETVGRIRRTIGKDGMVGLIYSDRSIVGQPMHHRLFGIDGRATIGDAVTSDAGVLISDTTAVTEDQRAAPAAVSNTRFRSRHMTFNASGHYFSPGFRSENGFLPEANSMGLEHKTEFLAYPKWKTIPRIFFYPANAGAAWHTDGEMRKVLVEPGFGSWFSNGAFFMIEGNHIGELYEEQWLVYDRLEGFTAASWTKWLRTRFGMATGQAPLYDPANPQIGWSTRIRGDIAIQPVPALIFSPVLTWERFLLNGQQQYDGWVGRFKIETFFTPQWWARLILDRSTFDEMRSIEALFAHEREPGKAIYLGGQIQRGGLNEVGEPDPTLGPNWQIFTKVSWVFGS